MSVIAKDIGIVLHKHENQTIPDDILTQVLKDYPSCLGISLVADGQLEVSKNELEDGISLSDMKSVLEALQGDAVTLFLAKFSAGYSPDDIQPFDIISNEGGHPIIGAYLLGDFTDYAKEGSKLSSAFYASNEYLVEVIKDMYNGSGGDLDKLSDLLDSPITNKNFRNLCPTGGGVILTLANGDTKPFFKSGNLKSEPWGWYPVAADLPSPVIKPIDKVAAILNKTVSNKEKISFIKKSTLPTATLDEVATDTSDPPFEVTAPLPPATRNEVATKVQHPSDGVEKKEEQLKELDKAIYGTPVSDPLVYPPSTIKGTKHLKKWYRSMTGMLPLNWSTRPGIIPKAAMGMATRKPEAIKSFQDMAKATLTLPKTEENIQKEKNKPTVLPSVVEGKLPIMGPQIKQSITNFLESDMTKKVIDHNSQVLEKDPTKMQEIEEKISSFCAQLGIGLDDTFKWPPEVFYSLADISAKGMAILAMNYRTALLNRYKEDELATKLKTEKKISFLKKA